MTSTAPLLDDDTDPGNAFAEWQLDQRLRQSKLIVVLDRADEDLQTITKKSFFGGDHDLTDEAYGKFVRLALTLEHTALNLPQKRELDAVFYEKLPQTLKALKTMKRHEYDMFAPTAIENLYTHTVAVLGGKLPAAVAEPTDDKKRGAQFKPGTRFPLYPSSNPDVTAALNTLGASWVMADTSALSTEDRYTINAVVDSYLPEAWGMVQKLDNHPAPVRAKAEAMFIQQLTLLQQQVDAIVERSTQSAFSAIQAYTLFLQNKTATTGLEL